MNVPKIANAIGQIDDELITAAERTKKAKRPVRLIWGAIAACLALTVAVGAVLAGGNAPADGATNRYRPYLVQSEDAAIVWSWQNKTVSERYTALTLDGVEYGSQGRVVSEGLIADSLGTHRVVGYDMIQDEQHSQECEVYRLKYVDQSQCVAVELDDTCYVFAKNEYLPPNTLGELFDLADLPAAIELSRFSENGDGADSKHFTLNNDDYIWQVLADCEDAEFVEDDWWMVHDREHLSFTVTSETLGVYRVAMYITADGYLWTNAFRYQYLFHIGEEAAGKIIEYAKNNSAEAEYQPYRNTVVGTITEITDEHILVDDALLCQDPTDGVTYKVPLDDLSISRYVDNGFVKVGDTVEVAYEGNVNDGYTVGCPYSIREVRIRFESEEDADTPDGGETVTMTTNAHFPE